MHWPITNTGTTSTIQTCCFVYQLQRIFKNSLKKKYGVDAKAKKKICPVFHHLFELIHSKMKTTNTDLFSMGRRTTRPELTFHPTLPNSTP